MAGDFAGRIIALVCLACLSVTQALAQCEAILDSKLMTDQSVIDEQAAASAMASRFCNMTYDEAMRSGSFKVGGTYKFNGGDASKSEQDYKKFVSENCGASSSEANAQKYSYFAQRALAPDVVKSWEACMLQRSGLSCYAKPPANYSSDLVTVVVNWRPTGLASAKVRSARVFDALVEDGASSNALFAQGDELHPGANNFTLRKKLDSTAVVNLTALYTDSSIHSCSIYVPAKLVPAEPPRAPPTPEWMKVSAISGKFCTTAAGEFQVTNHGNGYVSVLFKTMLAGQISFQSRPLMKQVAVEQISNTKFNLRFEHVLSDPAILAKQQAQIPGNYTTRVYETWEINGPDSMKLTRIQVEINNATRRDEPVVGELVAKRC